MPRNASSAAQATPPGTTPPAAQTARSQGGWSILVLSFDGEGAEPAAHSALTQFAVQSGLEGGRVERRGDAWVLLQGSYDDPAAPRAKSDLAAVQRLVSTAIFVPPTVVADAGSLPEFDLSRVRERYGADAVWTLQIAYYGRPDRSDPTPRELTEFRSAAEKAVLELRRTGEDAFYYHAPRGSTVTVGVFGNADQVTAVQNPDTGKLVQLPSPRESMRLVSARERHPLNLVNGAPLLVKERGSEVSRPQTSFLVLIPRP